MGISNAIVAGAQSIDFAITVERLRWVLDVWNKTRDLLQPPFDLGITIQDGSANIREHLLNFQPADIAGETGVLVAKVKRGGIGEGVFCPSDFIVSVSGLRLGDNGTVVDPSLSRAAPAIPLAIYASREPFGEFLEYDIIRQIPEEKIQQFGQETYERRVVEAHLLATISQGPREVYFPYEEIPFEIISGMVLVDMSLNAAREFGRESTPGTEEKPSVIIVNLLPQGDVMHDASLSKYAQPGTILRTVNFHPFESLQELRKLIQHHWHPDENTMIFTTDKHKILTLPVPDLRETNLLVTHIYGPKATGRCIPLSRASVGGLQLSAATDVPNLGVAVVPEAEQPGEAHRETHRETHEEVVATTDEIRDFEEELCQRLGITI